MEALRYTFMQQALVACAAVCATAPLVGTFVVQRRQSLIGDGMGHVAFAGVGLAFLFAVHPVLGALALTGVAAFVLMRLQRGGLGGDLSLALLFYGGIALGFLVMQRAGVGLNRLLSFLFGSPLNLSWSEVWTVVVLSAVVLLTVAALYGPLLSLAFDEQAARVSGIPTERLVLGLNVVVALVVVGGMTSIGLLLISAMMVVPVAAATQVTRSYRSTMLTGSLIGVSSAVLGLFVAFYADTTPGATIVLIAIAFFLAASGARLVRSRSATAAEAQ